MAKVIAVPRHGADGSNSWAVSSLGSGYSSGRPTSLLLTQLIEFSVHLAIQETAGALWAIYTFQKEPPDARERSSRGLQYLSSFQRSNLDLCISQLVHRLRTIDPVPTIQNVDRLQPITRRFYTGRGPTEEENAQGNKELFGVPAAED
jgi:hypothetical protein